MLIVPRVHTANRWKFDRKPLFNCTKHRDLQSCEADAEQTGCKASRKQLLCFAKKERALNKNVGGWLAASALCAGFLLLVTSAHGQEREVSFAGVAYSGQEATIAQRFPYALRYEESLKVAGDSINARALRATEQNPPQKLKLSTNPIAELKGRDQALVTSLVLNSETVSVENFGDVRKLFVLIRGQVLFFDFKSMTVVRSYPVSFAYIDNLNRQPSDQDILARVKLVFEGANDKPGLYGRFANTLAQAVVPQQTPRFLQVTKVSLGPEMLTGMPDYLKSTQVAYETWAADLVGEAISTRVGVPIIPYSKGYAIGKVLSMKVSDGTVYNLTLPSPDYEIHVDFKGLKKVKYSQNNVGTSYVYGAFADIRIEEPLSGTVYLSTALKNAEVKVVPASQTQIDDFPAFYDSVNGMFVKLAEAVAGKGNTWVKAAAGAADIEAQINKTKELMNLCK